MARVQEIVDDYYRRLLAFAYRLVDRADAKDVVQGAIEVYLRKAANDDAEEVRDVLSFLYGTVRKIAGRVRNRVARERKARWDAHAYVSPEECTMTAERVERVHRVLQALSVRDRRIVELRVLEERPTEEVARATSVSERTVRRVRTKFLNAYARGEE